MKPVYAGGYFKGGRIEFDDRFLFNAALKSRPDGRISIRIGPPTRSDDANAYYWLVLGFIEEHGETGHSAEDFHEYFKVQFIPKRVAIADGNGEIVDDRVIGGSTTKLNRSDFFDYVEKVRHWALTTLHVQTPDPDPALKKNARRVGNTAGGGNHIGA